MHQLFLVPYSFSAFCCLKRGVSRCKHYSSSVKGPRSQASVNNTAAGFQERHSTSLKPNHPLSILHSVLFPSLNRVRSQNRAYRTPTSALTILYQKPVERTLPGLHTHIKNKAQEMSLICVSLTSQEDTIIMATTPVPGWKTPTKYHCT